MDNFQRYISKYGSEKYETLLEKAFRLQLDIGDKFQPKLEKKEEKDFKVLKGSLILKGENIIFKKYSIPKKITLKDCRYRAKNDSERIERIFDKIVPICEFTGDYDIHEDDYEKYYNQAETIMKENKEKNKNDSIKRSRQKVLDYALCNPQLKFFSTLTYSENVKDYDIAYSDFQIFLNKVRKFMKRKYDIKFDYICTFEKQKRGAWHMHLLHNLDYKMFTDLKCELWIKKGTKRVKTEERKSIEQIFSKKFWSKGFVDFTELYDSSGSAFYISKYMSKDTEYVFNDMFVSGKSRKRYLCSQGLNQPVKYDVLVDDNTEEVIELLREVNKKISATGNSGNVEYLIKKTVYDDYITPVEISKGLYRKVTEISLIKKRMENVE